MDTENDNCEELVLASFLKNKSDDKDSNRFDDDDIDDIYYGDDLQDVYYDRKKKCISIEFTVTPLELELISRFRKFDFKEQLNIIAYMFDNEELKEAERLKKLEEIENENMTTDDLIAKIDRNSKAKRNQKRKLILDK